MERNWLARDVYTRIASLYVHLIGSGSQGSTVSEFFLVQTRDDGGDDDDDCKTITKKLIEGR